MFTSTRSRGCRQRHIVIVNQLLVLQIHVTHKHSAGNHQYFSTHDFVSPDVSAAYSDRLKHDRLGMIVTFPQFRATSY